MVTKRTEGGTRQRPAAADAQVVSEDLEQEVLRALLVQNDALVKSLEMLQVMTTILKKLLEERNKPVTLPYKPSDDVPFKPSETPAETVEQLKLKAARRNGPGPIRPEDLPPVEPEPALLDEPKGPTLADLKVALQACIAAHDQETARKCIAPYPTYSLVPLDKLAEVIARVEAATRSVVP